MASFVSNFILHRINETVKTVQHEAAHGRAALDMGYSEVKYYAGSEEPLSLGQLYFSLIRSGSAAGTGFKGIDDESLELDGDLTYSQRRAYVAAAGINEQSKAVREKVLEIQRKGYIHFSESTDIIFNKLSMNYYGNGSSNFLIKALNLIFVLRGDNKLDSNDQITDDTSHDLVSYVASLSRQGLISEDLKLETYNKILDISNLAALLSGGTWHGVISQIKYVKGGLKKTKIFTIQTPFGAIHLPEFTPFLNTKGMSLKADLSIDLTNRYVDRVNIGYEKIILGKCAERELSATVDLSGNGGLKSIISVVAKNNLNYGLSGKFLYPLGKKLNAIAKVGIDTGTMQGERECFRLDGKPCKIARVGIQYTW